MLDANLKYNLEFLKNSAMVHTLHSRINIPVHLLIFGIVSRGYDLISDLRQFTILINLKKVSTSLNLLPEKREFYISKDSPEMEKISSNI